MLKTEKTGDFFHKINISILLMTIKSFMIIIIIIANVLVITIKKKNLYMVTIITITNKIHIKEMNTITSLKTQTSQSPYTSISYSLSIKQLLTILRRAKIARHFPDLQLMKATVARAIRHSLSPTSLEIL